MSKSLVSRMGPRDMTFLLLRMGALMGGGVGLTIGFIFGSYSILRYATHLALLISVLPYSLTPPHPHKKTHTSHKGWCWPSRFPCHPLAVHAQQCGDILLLPCHRIGAFQFLFPSHIFLSLFLIVSPPLHFTLLNWHLVYRVCDSIDLLTRLPRSFVTIPFCHRILKPHDSRCFLL